MLLSLIIPAYNEADRIGPSVEKAYRFFESVDYDAEIVAVDDGSTDRTVDAIREAFDRKPIGLDKVTTKLIALGVNSGKGAAVRRGMLEAKGKVRVFTDADFSTPVSELSKLIPLISSGDFDVVIGSRAAEGRGGSADVLSSRN